MQFTSLTAWLGHRTDPLQMACYSYDPENRLTSPGGMAYTYDADGERLEKTGGSSSKALLVRSARSDGRIRSRWQHAA